MTAASRSGCGRRRSSRPTPRVVEGLPLGEHLLAERGAVGFFALTARGWLAVASAMHAARWYVRL